MKRVFSMLMALVFIAICFTSYGSADAEIGIQQSNNDSEINWDADYSDDRVIVCVDMDKHDYRETLTPEDFPEVNIDRIREIWVGEKCQIISIYLENTGRSAVREAVESLESNDIIESVGPNYCDIYPDVTITDPYYNQYQYALRNIDAPEAWEYTTGSTNVKVGIIDSGIIAHEDLTQNLGTGWDFYNNNSVTNDVVTEHGTMVAGIVGAAANGIGIVGVCPNVTLIPLQVTTAAGGFNEDAIAAAIYYAEENDIPILNLSVSYPNVIPSVEAAIRAYSGLLVCTAGNEGKNNDTYLHRYPSDYDIDNIISVAAVNNQNELASFSCYGATSVDIAAPGTGIFSTALEDAGYYSFQNGTSFAAPMVTGTAALLLSYNNNMTPYQIKKAILDSVDVRASLSGKVVSGGTLNAANALSLILDNNQVKNYKTVININSTSAIGVGIVEIGYNRELSTYIGKKDGSIIPNATYVYVDNVSKNLTWYSYDYPSMPITTNGVFCSIKYDTVFNNVNCLNSIYMSYNEFENSNGSVINPTVTMTKVLMGDLNNDGKITDADKDILVNAVSGSITLTNAQIIAADFNEDGNINLRDTSRLTQYIAGTRTTLW